MPLPPASLVPRGPRPPARHGPLAVLLLVGLASLAAAPISAHQASPCDALLEQAEEEYVAQAFDAAIASARRCLDRPDATVGEVRLAYRLITLIYLQQQNPRAAEETLAALLQADPGFRPDPVQDPPVFFAFAEGFLRRRAAAEVEQEPPPLPLTLSVRLGGASYGGERGVPGTTPFSDFMANVGLSLGLALGIDLADWARVAVRLDAHRLTSRFHHATAGPVPLRREDSSDWVGLASVEAVGTPPLPALAPARPTLHFGAGLAVNRLNGSVSTGLLLQPGVGVEVPVSRHVIPFALFEVGIVLPGEAVDLRSESHLRARLRNHDLLTAVGVGVRYALSPR